jgi:hypothetical protein
MLFAAVRESLVGPTQKFMAQQCFFRNRRASRRASEVVARVGHDPKPSLEYGTLSSGFRSCEAHISIGHN